MRKKKRIFFDMDGVLAKFFFASTVEDLYRKGYFLNLPPQYRILRAAKIISGIPWVDSYIISSVFADSDYAISEKNQWLDRFLPEIPKEKRFFPEAGTPKTQAFPFRVEAQDVLVDDYGVNVRDWNRIGCCIKVSKDAADAEKESRNYTKVISPDQSVNDIVHTILGNV